MIRDIRLLVALGVTGAAALALEVIWSRALIPWVGGTAMAQVATVGVYMLGLFFGSAAASRIVNRVQNPRKLFIGVEAAAAILSILMIWAIPLADPIFRALAQGPLLSGGLGAGLRGLAGGSLIFPATFLMGFGFPMAIAAYQNRGGGTSSTAWVYGVNTVGAAFGALVGGFVLVPMLGIILGALVVVTIDLMVLFWAGKGLGDKGTRRLGDKATRRQGDKETRGQGEGKPSTVDGSRSTPYEEMAMLLAVFVGGFVALGLEVMLFRILGLILGPTARAFTVVVTSYVLGLGLGALAVGRLVQKGPKTSRVVFIGAWVLAGLSVLFIHMGFDLLPLPLSRLLVVKGSSLTTQLGIKGLMAAVMLLPLTSAFGAAYAAAVSAGRDGGAQRAARLYAGLTLGNVLGLVVSAVWVLPNMGLEKGLLFYAGLGLVVPVLSLVGSGYKPAHRTLLVGGLVVMALLAQGRAGTWDWKKMLTAPYMYEESEIQADRQLIFLRSGFETTVAVFKRQDRHFFTLDGKVDGGNTVGDLRTQSLAGVLPAVLNPGVQTCLVIGLGTGQTVSEVLKFPLKSVACAEIVPAVTESLRFFEDINHGFWLDPRYQHIQADGRTVLRYGPGNYDLIISEPSNIWVPGVAHLFTREAFVEAREALSKPNGLFLQWIQGYKLDPQAFRMVVGTFLDVFPHVTLWGLGPNVSSVFLVGTLKPLKLKGSMVRQRLQQAGVQNYMAPGRALDEVSLLGTFIAGTEKLKNLASGVPLLYDGVPRLEYIAERSVLALTMPLFAKMLTAIQSSFTPYLEAPTKELAKSLDRKAEAYRTYRGFADTAGQAPVQVIIERLKALAKKYPQELELSREIADEILRFGRVFIAARRYKPAQEILTRALTFWPDHPDILADLAVLATYNRDFSGAMRYLDRMDQTYEGAWPLLLKGQVRMVEGRVGDAVPYFEKAVQEDPYSVDAFFNLGLCLQRLGRNAESLRAFRQVLELDPKNAIAVEQVKKLVQ